MNTDKRVTFGKFGRKSTCPIILDGHTVGEVERTTATDYQGRRYVHAYRAVLRHPVTGDRVWSETYFTDDHGEDARHTMVHVRHGVRRAAGRFFSNVNIW